MAKTHHYPDPLVPWLRQPLFKHIASFDALLDSMYSDLHVESATVSCLELFQVISSPLRVNTQPD